LDDLAVLPDLRFLTVLNGGVSDLSGLSGNGKLQSLIIDNFPRPDGIPQDSDLFVGDALASYDLAGSPQLDLGRLGYKPELRVLAIVASPVTGLAHLSQMSELHALWLLRAGLTEVPEITTLLHLRDLMLPYNDQISDVGPISSLLDLESLNLRGTRVADLGIIPALPKLERLDLKDTPAAIQSTTAFTEHLKVLR
jgi:internalin A